MRRICFFSILVITLIIAIWYWKYYKRTSERYFLWFLFYTLGHEVLGANYSYFFNGSNLILYNLYIFISFLFYFFWFHKVLKNHKWIVYILLSIFVLSFTYEAIFNNIYLALYIIPFFMGTLGVVILTISYFIELINSNTIVVLKRLQKFWIVIGLLFFYIGFAFTLLFFDIFEFRSNLFHKSVLFLNGILYGCYVYGFICAKNQLQVFKNST